MSALQLISYTPKHLKKWTMPSSYFGASHNDCYVFLAQHRDSDVVTRSNFEVGLERLGGTSETVNQIHEGHWAVGWVEWISIHESDIEALKAAEEMMESLDDYCVLDEDRMSEMEHEENFESCTSNMSYFLSDLCEELELDQNKLSKNVKKTLEQFIEAVFFDEGSYSGEAWFSVQSAKRRGLPECDYYRTMKGASKKIIKLLDKAFGE